MQNFTICGVYLRLTLTNIFDLSIQCKIKRPTHIEILVKINVLMYMCSRRFHNVLPEVSGCPNLGSSYEDKKKKKLIHLCAMLV